MKKISVLIVFFCCLCTMVGAMGEDAKHSLPEKIKIYDARLDKVVVVNTINKSDAEWKKLLSKEQYEVTTQQGTEKPFTCTFEEVKEAGIYECVRCGTDLFRAATKFKSGTGWPSYYEPISELNITTQPDYKLGLKRVEVLCIRCGAHLGHVFDDGPPPTGKRYCINGVALNFVALNNLGKLEQATFGAGCFWHVQEEFDKVKGIADSAVGFAGGTVPEPSYKQVCYNNTGHAEVVHLKYDPKVVSYEQLLDVFWDLHDPTTHNRQGPDVGSQYRSAIFYYNDEQKQAAIKSKNKAQKKFKNPIVTQISPAAEFFQAEEYHQKYYQKMKGQ